MPESRRVWLCVMLIGLACADDEKWDRNEKWCGDDSCYELLKLDASATHSDIKTNYKKLSLELHPDRNSSAEAAEVFPSIVVAYEILSDPERRKKHDSWLEMKKAMDSPRENPIAVAAVLFMILSVCTKYYQAQNLGKVKKSILQDGRVVRLLNEQNPDLKLPSKTGYQGGTGSPAAGRSERRKAARKEKKKAGKEEPAAPEDKVSNQKVQAALKELDIYVKGWNGGGEPTYLSAAISVSTFPLTIAMGAFSGGMWILNYYILKKDLTLEDAYKVCAQTNDFDDIGWSKMDQEERNAFLDQEGEWTKAWRVEKKRRREAEAKSK